MYKKTKFVLDDGTEFNTQKECETALNNQYGEAITTLAHRLTRSEGQYSKLISGIEENLELIHRISRLNQELRRGFADEND